MKGPSSTKARFLEQNAVDKIRGPYRGSRCRLLEDDGTHIRGWNKWNAGITGVSREKDLGVVPWTCFLWVGVTMAWLDKEVPMLESRVGAMDLVNSRDHSSQ